MNLQWRNQQDRVWRSKWNSIAATTVITIVLAAAGCESDKTSQLQDLKAENLALVSENRRLRNEVGELTVGDAQRVNVVRAPEQEAYTWKWRLWIPKETSFAVRAASGSRCKSCSAAKSGGSVNAGGVETDRGLRRMSLVQRSSSFFSPTGPFPRRWNRWPCSSLARDSEAPPQFVAQRTLEDWYDAFKKGGFAVLRPKGRSDRGNLGDCPKNNNHGSWNGFVACRECRSNCFPGNGNKPTPRGRRFRRR